MGLSGLTFPNCQRLLGQCFVTRYAVLATESGHYCPRTLTRDLEKLRHSPDIWLTGMKPGEESAILEQVTKAIPDRNIQMLSSGTVLTV